jgi:membrane protease subunit HflC
MSEPINITPKNMKNVYRLSGFVAILIVALIVLGSAMYTVGETEQAVLSQFGAYKEIVVSPNNTFVDTNMDLMEGKLGTVKITKAKGLRFKVPFITQVQKFDSRLLTYVSDSIQVNTLEKKQYIIRTYAQWKIVNPGVFATTQKNIPRAQQYLDNLIEPTIIQIINSMIGDDFINNKELLNEALAIGLAELNETVRTAGIEVEDVQINRTILPQANLQSTYDKMIANREAVAQQYRAEGQEAYQNVVSDADREARVTKADAIQQAELTKGEGDAEALEIYANAYSVDADFYTYWRSLQALEKSLNDGTTLILDSNHPLWSDLLEWVNPN